MTKKERIERLEFEVDQLQTAIAALHAQMAALQIPQQIYGPTKQWPYDPVKLPIDC